MQEAYRRVEPNALACAAAVNLARELAAKNVSPEAAMAVKFTMLSDMVEGMAHLHRKTGLAHLDFKTLNCFVGEGGVCKIADFGNSIETQKFDIAAEKLAGALMYVAPEAIDFHTAALRLRVERLLYDVSALSSKASDRDVAMARDAMHDVLAQRLGLRRDIDGAALDAWALGSTMFTTVFGRDIGQCDPQASGPAGERVNAGLKKLGAAQKGRVIDTGISDSGPQGNVGRIAQGAFAGSSGNALVDDLINGLMHLDPKQRLTLDQARNHRLFRETADIGNTDCRLLMTALASETPDPAQLRSLSRKLG